jgi:triphosphoribosyl-dephospho-CoA synthase
MNLSPGRIAELACLLEATARKPGNVHRFRDFADTSYLDFLLSATALVGPLDQAETTGVGPAILAAVGATHQLVRTNTNLGMILLLTPLAAVPEDLSLESGVPSVLASLTLDDARLTYQAIQLANPGGLGRVDSQDVSEEPTITLLEAMRLAAPRDLVARQYASGYADVFALVLPALRSALGRGEPLESAIVHAFLVTLAALPDSLVARKRGEAVAREASERAGKALETRDLAAFDAWLREDGHARNPGTTADLVTAALFAALRDGTIEFPLPCWCRGE